MRIAAYSLCLALAGCAVAPSRDARFARDLVGKWSEVRGDGCKCDREEQTIELRADRTFRVVGVRRDVNGSKKYSYTGEWKVEDEYFWYRITSAQSPELHFPGEERRDRIRAVTEWEWVTVEKSTGAETRAWRFPK